MAGPTLGDADFSLRFKLVNAVPIAVLAILIGSLLLAGAPSTSPSFDLLLVRAREFGWIGGAFATAGVVVFAILAEPLELASIRFLEGYWSANGPLRSGATLGRWIHRRRHSRLTFIATHMRVNEPARAESAEQALHNYPTDSSRILPTALGNRLRAFEDLGGRAYGLDVVQWWPRLHHVLPEKVLASVNQYRNQLDVATRLTMAFSAASVTSGMLLIRHPNWWILPVTLMAISILSYRAALAAASIYGVSVRAAIDVYRLRLLQEMRAEIPTDTNEERVINEEIAALWNGIKDANITYSATDSNHKIVFD